ncbi:MAG: hypothetical protein ACJASZ_002083 [Yoonia sp.]|jgi:hypothetical protein
MWQDGFGKKINGQVLGRKINLSATISSSIKASLSKTSGCTRRAINKRRDLAVAREALEKRVLEKLSKLP